MTFTYISFQIRQKYNNEPLSSSQNSSKGNSVRRPLIKKPPGIRHTKTSLNRIFKVNPLLRLELEGKKEPTIHLNNFKLQSLDGKKSNNDAKNASNYPKNKNLKPPLRVNPKPKRVRRSLSAQHFGRKKGINSNPQSCYIHHKLNSSHSMEDLGHIVDDNSRIYKSPTAPTMNFILDTPIPVDECFSFNWTSTPKLLFQSKLQKRLILILLLIRRKFSKLKEQPEFWNCKAAIGQIRENIPKVVECYQNAIIRGAHIKSVDISLDNLCNKFNILKTVSQKEQDQKGRLKIMQDVRSVFKSSIITVAVLKQKNLQKEKSVETQGVSKR